MKRYTLPIPNELYEELNEQAKKHDKSIKEVLRQCLRFGLIAMKVADDPNAEICFKERIHTAGSEDRVQERVVQFIW